MNNSNYSDRRQFLKQTAGAGLAGGIGPLLASCGGGDELVSVAPAKNSISTEIRTYFFDLSNAHPETDFFLVSGSKHHPLKIATAAQIERAKSVNSVLQAVSSQNITHVGDALVLPARMQLCYIKGVPRGGAGRPGEWHMHSMFYHVPLANAALAAQKVSQSCGKNLPVSLRSEVAACLKGTANASSVTSVLTSSVQEVKLATIEANNSSCVGPEYDQYKDYFDHAMALVCNHPEIGSFDAPTLSYVQQVIVCTDRNLVELAVSLYQQGPATTTPGGWATLVEYIDPATQLPKLASNGDKLYFNQHSAKTLQLTGAAIRSILPKVKNDPMLGASIAGLSPSNSNSSLQGKMWVTQAGTPTRLPAVQPPALSSSRKLINALLGDSSAGPTWTARDLSSGNGFRVTNVGGDARNVSFTVQNWYLRYLGLYIRFLDGAGNPIELSKVSSTTPFITSLSGKYDAFLNIVNQEFVLLGIPVSQDSQDFTVNVPDGAASFQILASGLGRGSNSYPHTVAPGAVMTVVLDLAVPSLFLIMAASAGFSSYQKKLALATSTTLLMDTAKIFVQVISDAALEGAYNDPAVFKNLVLPIATTIKDIAKPLWAEILAALAEGEAEGVAEDFIPFGVGLAIQAVMALGIAAAIAETSAEIANAPWTFVTQIDATHDLTVTINHDPDDTAGFPATATYYKLTAICDGGSPAESGAIPLPATTRTKPVQYIFRNLPSGGKVTVTVAFYSATDWLAGTGTTGSISNTADAASITIKENLVPLTTTTQYKHKQKLGLDSSNNHIWIAGPQPAAPPVTCDNAPGNLCILQGITVSETFGNVGYTWKSYSQGVRAFGSGAAGQLYQFANISFTDNPQSSWLHSGGGFPSPARLAYSRTSPISQNFYIDTSRETIVRRINMTAVNVPPTFDNPDSKLSVGRFNFPSDAFLIHPTGKLISINAQLSKLEVLAPAANPVSDADAPLAIVCSGPGNREGLLNGPVSAVVAPGGAILVLEQAGNRIQAFDTGGNPTPFFAGFPTMALKPQTGGVEYLDMAIEFVGYIYVLSKNTNTNIYSLDIYTPAGSLLATTNGMNVSKLAIDLFRNVYTLNFETIQPVGFLTEPSVSQWIPSTPLN